MHIFESISHPSLHLSPTKSAPTHGQDHHGTLDIYLVIKGLLLGLRVFP
jgi:hypothetical protein